ncbi:MAG: DUF1800 domain-containing protein [Acidobacteriota bacterium]
MQRNRLSLLLAAGMVLLLQTGDAATVWDKKLKGDEKIEHALNRLAFGPKPGDAERVKKLGLEKWIAQQLEVSKSVEPVEPPELVARLEPLDSTRMPMGEMTAKYPPRQLMRALAKAMGKNPDEPIAPQRNMRDLRALRNATPEARREEMAKRAPQLVVTSDLIENKIYRAVYSERQLEEVLVDFWFNHFNVYLNKGPVRHLVTSYERDAIRPYVLGKFGDMLRATAEHPAMLVYLDNWQSVDPQAVARMRRQPKRLRGLNENYGRELLELHTLGADGGYTQKDVVEVARCFTGWTVGGVLQDPKFLFAERLHDKGEKTVLGQKIAAGGGKEDALKVIDILAAHPSTAKFISRKLAQRFVADEPPQQLVDRMAATFTKTGGDLREVMKTMIQSREFFSEGAYRAKMKSPFEMVVSAVRAVNADVRSAMTLSRSIDELGQPLYRKEEPTGYGNTSEDWVSTAGLLARMNFSQSLTQNKLRGVTVAEESLARDQALKLGAPEFQRR